MDNILQDYEEFPETTFYTNSHLQSIVLEGESLLSLLAEFPKRNISKEDVSFEKQNIVRCIYDLEEIIQSQINKQ